MNSNARNPITFLTALLLTGGAHAVLAEIHAVGSGTVYPFSAKVSEEYSSRNGKPTPRVEGIGTGAGFRTYCNPATSRKANIINASRPAKPKEISLCNKNDRHNLVEFGFGFDGITIGVNRKNPLKNITLEQLYLGLAKYVPAKDKVGFIENPHKRWKDIDPLLPNDKIEVYGPYAASGTRDTVETLILERQCKKTKAAKALSKKYRKIYCRSVRSDGGYIESADNYNLIVSRINANKKAFGIFGYSYLNENRRKAKALTIDGVIPTQTTIASGEYKISRLLYLYASENDLTNKDVNAFLREFFSERAIGDRGYLQKNGLVPLKKIDRAMLRKKLKPIP